MKGKNHISKRVRRASNKGSFFSRLNGSGQSLPKTQEQFFSSKMHHDLSNVRIHTGEEAERSASSINAQAYTYNNHIVFNKNKYQPETTEGKKLLAHELTHVKQQSKSTSTISRKILMPFEKLKPLHAKKQTAPTQGKIAEDLLNTLCVEGGITVSGGFVREPVDLCDLPGPLGTNPALTKAEQSKTKTGCTCICDLVKSSNTIKLIIDDGSFPNTLQDDEKADIPGEGGGSTVTVPSPDGDPITLPTKSGKLTAVPPAVILGHELCGHAWLMDRGAGGLDEAKQRGRGGHQAAVERENLIRDEQGVERRATFREPYCGEDPKGDYIKECKIWREEYNKLNGTNYKIEDTIPEDIFGLEDTPADFRIDVGFNMDMPQPWFNPAASFNVSTTSEGKEWFGYALAVLKDNPKKNFQLEAHASSDKPANDPTYNDRLSERRVRVVLKELIKREIDESRKANKKDSSCASIETGLKNCGDSQAGAPGNAADRKVVIRIW